MGQVVEASLLALTGVRDWGSKWVEFDFLHSDGQNDSSPEQMDTAMIVRGEMALFGNPADIAATGAEPPAAAY